MRGGRRGEGKISAPDFRLPPPERARYLPFHITMRLRFRNILLPALACAATARADVVTLGAARDNAIVNGANQSNSNGGGPAFFAGTDGNNAVHRALLAFDFSSIPAGSTITNVQLTLTLGQVASGGPASATISLYSLTQNWGEGTAGSTAAGITGTGQGFTPGTGDATWNASSYSATTPALWTTAGGDHAAAASATLLLGTNVLNTSFTWLSTAQLVADVQGWLNSPATNFGWELINANEVTARSIYGFYSREWSNAHFGGSAAQTPSLQVTYTPAPEPTSVALLAAALLGCLTRRSRDARKA